MRRLLTWVVALPLGVILVLFAVANRSLVTVSLDPFSTQAPAYAARLPLFLVILAAVIVGVVIGGTAVWFAKIRWQFAALRAERELSQLRAEKAAAELEARSDRFGSVPTLPRAEDRVAAD